MDAERTARHPDAPGLHGLNVSSGRALDVGGSLTASGPGGSLALSGEGRAVVLETRGMPVVRLFRLSLSAIARRTLVRDLSLLLEGAGVRLRVERRGRVFLTLGPGCRGGGVSRLLGGAAVRCGLPASP